MTNKTSDQANTGAARIWAPLLCVALFLGMGAIAHGSVFTGNVNTLWSNPNNWNPMGLPSTAEIPSGKVVDIDIAAGVSSLTTQPNSVIRASGGSITVTGTFNCNGGQMGSAPSPFQLTISNNATMFIAASNAHRWDAVVINNAGKIDWAGGDVRCGALINNSGLWLIHGDGFFGETGIGGLIVNTGRIIKETGNGTTSFYGFNGNDYRLMRINNTGGSIAVASGTLDIGAGDGNGNYEVGAQHTLRFVGGPAKLSGVTFTGGGTCEFNAPSEIRLIGTIETKIDLKSVTGFIAGDGAAQNQATLQGSGRLVWESGRLAGTLTLGSDLRSVVTGGAGKSADNLTNKGTMSWFGPGPMSGLIQNEGTLDLLAAGTFTGYGPSCNLQNTGTINTFGGGTNKSEAGTFVNAGFINIGGFGTAGILNISPFPYSYQQTATGALYMEIGGTNADTPQFDQLTGPAGSPSTMDGTLTVDVINGYTPPTGARFVLMNNRTGQFSRVFPPGGTERSRIEYPNPRCELVSLSDAPIPLRLWGAGPDLARNESPDRAAELQAVNATVPQWSYGRRSTAAGTGLTLFTPEQHINDASGLQGWIAPGQITLGVNTKNTPIVFNTGSGNYRPLRGGQIYLSPGPNNEFLVARWTAPAAGDYRFAARWFDLDEHGGNGATAHFVVNGTEQFAETFEAKSGSRGRARMRAQTVSLKAGEFVDFVLGSNGDSSFDATAFNAVVRRVPKVTTTPAQEQTILEGQDVTLDVAVDHVAAITSVALDVDGDIVERKSLPPYHFVQRLEPGTHYVRAIATEDRQAPGVSLPIKVTVTKAPSNSGASAKVSGPEAQAAAAVTPGKTYYCVKDGYWENPTTWSPQGVPSTEGDQVVIGAGFTVLLNRVEAVGGMELVGRIERAPGSPDFVLITVIKNLTITGGEVRGIPGRPKVLFVTAKGANIFISLFPAIFRDVDLDLRGSKLNLVGGGIISERSSLTNTGTLNLQPPPGTQERVNVDVGKLNHNGGRFLPGPNITLTAPQGANIAAPVVLSPNSAISESGSTLISDNGAALIGLDGGTLIGLDGGSLVGNDGSTLVGNDGSTLVGNDGSTLIGLDGGSIQPTRADSGNAATAGGILLTGGTITGTGELRGNVVNQGSFIAPGNSAGGIVVNGNYTQEAGGTLVLEIGGKTFSPFSYDIFQVTKTATLGGNLVVKTINGYAPASGETVSPLLYGSKTGNFASVSSNVQISLGATSAQVNVTGPNPPGPRALNISTRLQIQSGDNALFAGFIVTGPAGSTKKVMIRGIGPSLAQFGIAGAIADPFLELHTSSATITNDNWQQAPNANEIPNGFAPSDSRESIIIATLAPGNYSAILKGAHGETGVGLAEVYDLDSGSAQLANIATRGLVQTGDNVLIGGFIIAGKEPANVLVRAIGPSLSAFGVQGALQDTTLEVHDSNGGVISNDNWRSTQEAEIIATTIPPSHSNESAVLAVLTPGNYTAVVRGKDNTTGIAVVEAYNIQ